ncbi:hypothetical protein J2R76_004046 [Bradyrhizobium sp. USDA 4532]|uniref:hypothetical protein n=1 Tax=unclassified Bradyrhizobium TaxID=2631580 RepID=UPI00209E3327|nr:MULTISPECIES: hypothetical protein [unclassified Bradyrhizobium]MCP1835706.1 hypothetical protein [Bradyrhizobium sp. USDA 4545]MCP1920455.1 hypothetical protein [Bradyrhizobium sp. USDA 4532]
MLLHIALVSLTKEVSLAQLAPVSAAIQKQVSRDFGPLWNVDATVDAFGKLEDVPVGYWHVLLQDELRNGAAGLHQRDDDKQPFALVGLTNNWTVFMSHEVLEMLVDPQGTLTRTGNSLKSGQGRVEYLIEVCDPCQSSKFAYSVNSVLVSDFYTPHYFDPVKTSSVRYSYSGQVRGPREVLDGGYLSWFDPQTRHLFQFQVDGTKATIADKGDIPLKAESLRAFSDRVSVDRREAVIEGGSRTGLLLNAATDYRTTARIVKPKPTVADDAQAAHARNLRAQLEQITSAR